MVFPKYLFRLFHIVRYLCPLLFRLPGRVLEVVGLLFCVVKDPADMFSNSSLSFHHPSALLMMCAIFCRTKMFDLFSSNPDICAILLKIILWSMSLAIPLQS